MNRTGACGLYAQGDQGHHKGKSDSDEVELVERLLRDFRNGDESARDKLVDLLADQRRLGKNVRRLVRCFLTHKSPLRTIVGTDDIHQSALREAYRNLHAFNGDTEGQLLMWIRRIAWRKVLYWARKRRLESVANPDSFEGESVDALAEAELRELTEKLYEALARLDLKYRLVMELRICGYQTAQISRALCLKPATVRKRESIAMQQMRKWSA